MAYIQSHSGQSWLLPPGLEDMIPEDHICFLIESLADSLDYSRFDDLYSGGRASCISPEDTGKVADHGGSGPSAIVSATCSECQRECGVYVFGGEVDSRLQDYQ